MSLLLFAATCIIGHSLTKNRYRGEGPVFIAPAFTAGPYVQFGPVEGHRVVSTSRSMVIRWIRRGSGAGPRYLLLGEAPSSMKMIPEDPGGDGTRHTVTLTGLVPSKKYWYRVPDACNELHHFTTGPDGGIGAPFRFSCIGDSGNTREGGNSFSYRSMVLKAADRYYQKIGAPSFTLHLGDAVRTGMDLPAWNTFFYESHRPWSDRPNMMTLGNHECLEDHGAHFAYFFTHPSYYSFDYGNTHVLVIHPFDGIVRRYDGPVVSTGKEQYLFAREDLLRQGGKKWIVVSMHIPILSTGDYNHNEILMNQYLGLFEKCGVHLVMVGHDHHFDSFFFKRGNGRGTLYVVNGGGGSALDSYIMDRKEKQWRQWFHQKDDINSRHHVYGELSWGFVDTEVKGDTMTVRYLRWLDYHEFLSVTGQEHQSWRMTPLADTARKGKHLLDAVPVKEFVISR